MVSKLTLDLKVLMADHARLEEVPKPIDSDAVEVAPPNSDNLVAIVFMASSKNSIIINLKNLTRDIIDTVVHVMYSKSIRGDT